MAKLGCIADETELICILAFVFAYASALISV